MPEAQLKPVPAFTSDEGIAERLTSEVTFGRFLRDKKKNPLWLAVSRFVDLFDKATDRGNMDSAVYFQYIIDQIIDRRQEVLDIPTRVSIDPVFAEHVLGFGPLSGTPSKILVALEKGNSNEGAMGTAYDAFQKTCKMSKQTELHRLGELEQRRTK